MENASKALIIAGAILLSILIIAIGMYIYNSSSNSIQNAAGQISQQDISAFNNQIEMYQGRQVGTNVKSLISTIASICKENSSEATKLPDLYYQASSSSGMEDVETSVGDTDIQSRMNKAKALIESRHYYYVYCLTSETSGLVNCVVISYEQDDDILDSYEGNDA